MKTCEVCGRSYPKKDWYAWKHQLCQDDDRTICYPCKYQELQDDDDDSGEQDLDDEPEGTVNGVYLFA